MWPKVQDSASTILETQGYALRQLQDLTEELEQHKRVDELVKTAREAEVDVKKWLTVLAQCFQLRDAVGALELDRVLDSAPDELDRHRLDRHRLGLQAARQKRLELISQSTSQLIERMDAAAAKANSKVLLNPIQ